MKTFLFLYPIKEYIDDQRERYRRVEDRFPIPRLWDIVDARYRKNGFIVYWLLFGEMKNPSRPDYSQLYSQDIINEGDRVISCGVPFETHVSEKIYPNSKKILAKLLRPMEQLVIGGFHQWDCVSRVAECAFRQGINTFIDDDTTEMLFCRTRLGIEIPLVRTDWSFSSFGYTKEKGFCSFELRHIKNTYKKPWFMQH